MVSCPHCDATFKNQAGLEGHIYHKHNLDPLKVGKPKSRLKRRARYRSRQKCPYCQEVFARVARHIKIAHPEVVAQFRPEDGNDEAPAWRHTRPGIQAKAPQQVEAPQVTAPQPDKQPFFKHCPNCDYDLERAAQALAALR